LPCATYVSLPILQPTPTANNACPSQYSPFGAQSCPESEIIEARDILTERCGLHAAWLIHDRPQGKTYTYDGYPTTVCNNMFLKMNMKVALNTTTTTKDGVVFNTVTFASEDDE